jgi:DNA repair ATPase RecN
MVIEQQLNVFQKEIVTKNKLEDADIDRLDAIENQFLPCNPLLAAISNLASDLIKDPDFRHDATEVQCILDGITERFEANRQTIAEKRRWLTNVFQKRDELRVTSESLDSWLASAMTRLGETCTSVAANRVACEQQLAALVVLETEFDDWQKALEADSARTFGQSLTVDQVNTVRKFMAARKACMGRLDKQRQLSCLLDDVQRLSERIKTWSVAIVRKFGVDKSGISRLAIADMKRAFEELKSRQEHVEQLRNRAENIVNNLRLGVEGERCTFGRKTEKSFFEPLGELEVKLNGVSDTLSDKVKLMVCKEQSATHVKGALSYEAEKENICRNDAFVMA